MKTSQVLTKFTSSIFLAALVVGCSAKVSGGASGGLPGQPTQKQGQWVDTRPAIQGPDVVGHWQSKCNLIEGKDTYRRFDITYTESNTSRLTTTYSDAQCAQQITQTSKDGPYRFVEKYETSGYEIEYQFKLDTVDGTYEVKERVDLRDENLFIANLGSGSLMPLLENEPLVRIHEGTGTAPPAPPKQDPNAEAIPATTYGEALAAYCVVQGWSVLIDFNGADLSKDSDGQINVGTKQCGSSDAFNWSKTGRAFTIRFAGDYPKFELGADGASTITTDSSATGLSKNGYPRPANINLNGNSGVCVFLKNKSDVNAPLSCNH